jgi:hypothetical protein
VHVVTYDGINTRIVGVDVLIADKGAMAKQELRQIGRIRRRSDQINLGRRRARVGRVLRVE